jgi:hypothetical protein
MPAIVCACFGVGHTICETIAAGAFRRRHRLETQAGWSCLPELKRLIAQAEVAAAPQKLAVAN